jgi:hypothetical protein
LLSRGAQDAAQRVELMHRIGIEDVQVAPLASPSPGHFVVTGVWVYTEKNLASLNEVLAELRALYHDRLIGTDPKGATSVVGRLLARWKGS